MKKHLMALSVLLSFLITLAAFPGSANAESEKQLKEWTFLVFLNGHNNLDSFGDMNIRQMEQIGSSDKNNILVQWASLKNGNTKRLYIEKSTNPNKVTSPVVQDMAPVDMGNYKELVNFVEWGVKNYPAKHYFVAVWNHGNGWHRQKLKPRDISYDDLTDNKITTEQLALAMEDSAKIIGHKVDIYGSDACLMSMAEVATEMASSVDYFVGSQEVEPGEGWPYNTFLKAWSDLPQATPAEVSKTLAKEYLKAYSGGIYGQRSVTLSAFDLSHMDSFNKAVSSLNAELKNLSLDQLKSAQEIASNTLAFYSSDYKDISDFVVRMSKNSNLNIKKSSLDAVKVATEKLVIINQASPYYKESSGVSVWIPVDSYEYEPYAKRYEGLKFTQATQWHEFLASLNSLNTKR